MFRMYWVYRVPNRENHSIQETLLPKETHKNKRMWTTTSVTGTRLYSGPCTGRKLYLHYF